MVNEKDILKLTSDADAGRILQFEHASEGEKGHLPMYKSCTSRCTSSTTTSGTTEGRLSPAWKTILALALAALAYIVMSAGRAHHMHHNHHRNHKNQKEGIVKLGPHPWTSSSVEDLSLVCPRELTISEAERISMHRNLIG